MPPKKISPEISEPKHEEDPLYPFDLHVAASRCPEYMPPKKTVASPKVLAASRRRRGPSKQGTRLHKCPHCCETFTARHNLTRYRPYRCDACGLSFGTKHVLKRHQKTCQMHASTSLTHYVN
ncbi:hypothetical protein BT96DRAFT_711265 [Gymnopus androsaceus JB14]|uniref:C2H2-type domain-containing protein n=1 Tax=Gymnopus androsaceus JB14 TaxID=1447944 RepID=A0A6A4GEH9_9AGAR|nr:hypothetical protein BT96DRAFT_711265 [Gymnopus androsaceus JB14]